MVKGNTKAIAAGGVSLIAMLMISSFFKDETKDSTVVQPPKQNFSAKSKFDRGAEEDTYEDTLRTVSQQLKSVRQELADEAERNRLFREKIEAESREQKNEIFKQFIEMKSENNKVIEDITKKAAHEASEIAKIAIENQPYPTASTSSFGTENQIPEVFTLNDDDVPNLKSQASNTDFGKAESPRKENKIEKRSEEYTEIDPVDMTITYDRQQQPIKSYPTVKNDETKLADIEPTAETDSENPNQKNEKKKTKIEFATIPQNSTLLNGTAFTALIGRVPIDGKVIDPFRFKIIVGENNIAANRHKMPHLKEIVMSGVASGDYTMECVRGDVKSATFVFNDGTIRTVNSRKGEGLGYITDEFGVECMPGEYLSNFPKYAATSGMLSGLRAIAEGLADSQTTEVSSGDSVTSALTGDAGMYAAGKGVGGGLNSIDGIISKRMGEAFDAVFISAGKSVNVQITQEIQIDYEIEGRKLLKNQRMVTRRGDNNAITW